MNYSAPEILTQLNQLLLAQQVTMENRTLINALFNGDTPYTPEEQQQENIYTNVNFLESTRIASNAVNQLNKSFESGDSYFRVRVDKGPQRMRSYYSEVVSNTVNRLLKRQRAYRNARKSARAQVVLHGPGPLLWRNSKVVLPSTAGIEDVLVPNGTLCDMENLDRFGVYQEMTWPQLEKAALGPVVDKGWNLPYVKEILGNLYKTGYVPTYYGNRWMFPEKLQEDYKEGAARAFSSSLPKALVWNFFYRNEETGKWNRKMMLDYANAANMGFTERDAKQMEREPQLLYEREDYCEEWQNVLHWYIGNCSNVAPYRYHSIRSIGYLLYGTCMLQNKLRCRLSDHIFQQLLTWFRNVSEDNREQLGLIDLQNFGVLPDGVSMVTAQERHVADWNLVLMGLNQNRQLMAESSSSFLPDMQGALGSEGKEMTATETLVRQNTSITLTSAVISQLAEDALDEYNEIVRRLCIKDNPDPLAKRFREEIQEAGVPLEVMDAEAWQVFPQVSMGGGNKAAELTGTQVLMTEIYPLVDPDAQRVILRKRIAAITDNPEEAMMLVPEAPQVGGDDVQYAQMAFGVLLSGVPFRDKEGVDHVVMATVLMELSQVKLQQAEVVMQQPLGLGMAAETLAGVANVLSHTQGEVQKVAQAAELPGRKELVKGLGKRWEELNGALQQLAKAVMAAEQEQAQASPNGEDAKLMAKLKEIQATAEVQRQIAGASAQQKMEQKQISWMQENERRNADTAAEIERTNARTATELQNSAVKAQGEVAIATIKEAKKPAPKAAGPAK